MSPRSIPLVPYAACAACTAHVYMTYQAQRTRRQAPFLSSASNLSFRSTKSPPTDGRPSICSPVSGACGSQARGGADGCTVVCMASGDAIAHPRHELFLQWHARPETEVHLGVYVAQLPPSHVLPPRKSTKFRAPASQLVDFSFSSILQLQWHARPHRRSQVGRLGMGYGYPRGPADLLAT